MGHLRAEGRGRRHLGRTRDAADRRDPARAQHLERAVGPRELTRSEPRQAARRGAQPLHRGLCTRHQVVARLLTHRVPVLGVAVRLLGETTSTHMVTLQNADAIVVEESRRSELYNKVWQAFAMLLPVRSVGVMGDGRTYGLTVAVGVVESDDAMTADWVRLPGEVLDQIATRIGKEGSGVTGEVYDRSSKPRGTMYAECKSS